MLAGKVDGARARPFIAGRFGENLAVIWRIDEAAAFFRKEFADSRIRLPT